MRIEHVAFQMEDPVAAARWYCTHLGFTVKRSSTASPFGHFLADATGQVMVEIYRFPDVTVPDYKAMDARILHLALVVGDVAAERTRLLTAGAAPEGQVQANASGDRVVMVRDPWGFPVQLVSRAVKMV
jgi:glyoxylase I family protein